MAFGKGEFMTVLGVKEGASATTGNITYLQNTINAISSTMKEVGHMLRPIPVAAWSKA
jgi:hypothetical protein